MKLSLLSAIPCSRVDAQPCCEDGRGGWVYSQCGPCRCFTNFNEATGLLFALSVYSNNVDTKDGVERTELFAYQNDRRIGSSALGWDEDNTWGKHLSDGAVYSWPQFVNLRPEHDGIVEVRIYVKLRSQEHAVEVEQSAFCHVRQEDRDSMQLPPWKFIFKRLTGRSKRLTG